MSKDNITESVNTWEDFYQSRVCNNSPFDSCVSMIKWLIAKGYFSKEFLL